MREHRAPLLLLLGLTAVLFLPFWAQGRVFVPGDFLSFIYPWKALHAEPQVRNLELFDVMAIFVPVDLLLDAGLREGRIPLWNPYIFCGHPVAASGQSGFFYPVRLALHAMLETPQARTVSMWLHMLLMGSGMYVLLLRRGRSSAACFLGAVVWMLNSFAMGWLEFEHVPVLSGLLAWALVGLDAGLEGRRWGFPLMGLLLGCGLLAGHLQLNLYVLALVVFYGAVRVRRSSKVLGALAALAAAFLIAGPALVPFAEYLPLSGRRAFGFEEIQGMASPLWMILPTLLCPDAWGNPAAGFLVNRTPMNYIFPEFACFAGVIPLALAVGVVRERRLWPFHLLILVALLFAAATPVYRVVTSLVPFLQQLIPGRILFVVPFALAILAAEGVDLLPSVRRRVAVAAGALATLWAAWLAVAWWLLHPGVSLLQPYMNPRWIKIPAFDPGPAWLPQALDAARSAVFANPQAWLSLLLLAGFAAWLAAGRPVSGWALGLATGCELLLFAVRFNPAVPPAAVFPPAPSLQFLAGEAGRVQTDGAAFYDTLMPYGISTVQGYESLVSLRYLELLGLVQGEPVNLRTGYIDKWDSPLLDMLGVRWVLVNPHFPPRPLERVFSEGMTIYRRPGALPRAWVVGQVDPGGLRTLGRPDFDPRRVATVEEPVAVDPAAAGSAVEVVSSGTDRLVLEVEMRAPGLVVLSEAWLPGWEVSTGRLVRVNHALRGVELPAGAHRVVMEYRPRAVRVGLWLALAGLVLAALSGLRKGPRPARRK